MSPPLATSVKCNGVAFCQMSHALRNTAAWRATDTSLVGVRIEYVMVVFVHGDPQTHAALSAAAATRMGSPPSYATPAAVRPRPPAPAWLVMTSVPSALLMIITA